MKIQIPSPLSAFDAYHRHDSREEAAEEASPSARSCSFSGAWSPSVACQRPASCPAPADVQAAKVLAGLRSSSAPPVVMSTRAAAVAGVLGRPYAARTLSANATHLWQRVLEYFPRPKDGTMSPTRSREHAFFEFIAASMPAGASIDMRSLRLTMDRMDVSKFRGSRG